MIRQTLSLSLIIAVLSISTQSAYAGEPASHTRRRVTLSAAAISASIACGYTTVNAASKFTAPPREWASSTFNAPFYIFSDRVHPSIVGMNAGIASVAAALTYIWASKATNNRKSLYKQGYIQPLAQLGLSSGIAATSAKALYDELKYHGSLGGLGLTALGVGTAVGLVFAGCNAAGIRERVQRGY